MQSIRLTRNCPICNCANGRHLHTQRFVLSEGSPLQDSYDVVACNDCGFCFADTAVTQDAYDEYYADMSKYADSGTSTGAGTSAWDAERLEQLAKQISAFESDKSANILDVGCANGGLLVALQHNGYQPSGIDPSPICVQQAQQMTGGSVWAGSLTKLPSDIGKFDGIVLSHVMEHVRDLKNTMECVRELLKPSGWIYIEVPDAMRYAQFLVAPFQDFNTEHINHFSLTSLTNLCFYNGFSPAYGGEKEIFSAKDMPYPALFLFARRSEAPHRVEKDEHLCPAVLKYIQASQALMERMDAQIRKAIDAHVELIVWGTGQLTMKLLAETCLRNAKIAAFVDGNPVNHGQTLLGRKILSGRDLSDSKWEGLPILVSSLINCSAIIDTIRNLGLTNPIITLGE